MAEGIPLAFPVDLTRKWRALAERRKAHLVDLYDSGRWRLYYSEQEYILRLREAIGAVERWSATEQSAAREAVVLSISPAEAGDSAPLGDADGEVALSGLGAADDAAPGDADEETPSGLGAADDAVPGDADEETPSGLGAADDAAPGDADEETLSSLEAADSASLGDADDETLSGARADDNASSGDFDGQMLSALEAELERESA